MNCSSLCFVLLFLSVIPASLAAKQYVEIERRPSSNHDRAGTFSFAFGLTVTFIALLVMILFVGAFLRSSTMQGKSAFKEKPMPHLLLPSISTATSQSLNFGKWTSS